MLESLCLRVENGIGRVEDRDPISIYLWLSYRLLSKSMLLLGGSKSIIESWSLRRLNHNIFWIGFKIRRTILVMRCLFHIRVPFIFRNYDQILVDFCLSYVGISRKNVPERAASLDYTWLELH